MLCNYFQWAIYRSRVQAGAICISAFVLFDGNGMAELCSYVRNVALVKIVYIRHIRKWVGGWGGGIKTIFNRDKSIFNITSSIRIPRVLWTTILFKKVIWFKIVEHRFSNGPEYLTKARRKQRAHFYSVQSNPQINNAFNNRLCVGVNKS